MSIGFKIGSIITEVGTADFLHAFFSTVSYRLEPGGWGSRFPALMNELFQGRIEAASANTALKELDTIQSELKEFMPGKVVWDIYDLKATPPWGNSISDQITSLSNYFVTSDGKDLIEVIRDRLQRLKVKGGFMEIKGVGLIGKK